MTAATVSPGLYLVSTPIGNARDITLRALDVLAGADVLAAEDTRVLRKLLDIHGIPLAGRPLIAHHDHSDAAARAGLVALVRSGKAVALCSDAGTPLVADPGYELVREVVGTGLALTALPGPSSVLAGLSLSGLATDRFCFVGFAPRSGAARQSWLTEVAAIPATLVIFETGVRIKGLLTDMCEVLGPERPAALARELTKKFEEVRRETLAGVLESVETDPPRGEIVLVVARAAPSVVSGADIDAALREALAHATLRDAVDAVSAALGAPRRLVYQRALELAKG